MSEPRSEIEKMLEHISDARAEALRAAELATHGHVEPRVVGLLEHAERQLEDLQRAVSEAAFASAGQAGAGQESLAV
jgi:hypothetical protein